MNNVKNFKEFLNETIFHQLKEPIIPDALELIKQAPDAVKFTDRKKYDLFLKKQNYFSASETWCFQSMEDKKRWSENGSKSGACEDCHLMYETGRLLVAVWDSKTKVGYILPSDMARSNKYRSWM